MGNPIIYSFLINVSAQYVHYSFYIKNKWASRCKNSRFLIYFWLRKSTSTPITFDILCEMNRLLDWAWMKAAHFFLLEFLWKFSLYKIVKWLYILYFLFCLDSKKGKMSPYPNSLFSYFVIHFTKFKFAGSNSISCLGITLNV